ncbi:MAG: ABC transporter permease subunit [Lachnospiraceae bacterium]|jgi:NitT/TauT family transport system permease protein|nr:ABC transporter permease subunit [Lachnospiraceae bacterium]
MAEIKSSTAKSDLFKRYGVRIFVICFWLLFWEILYRVIDNEIFLVSPLTVASTLRKLAVQAAFWQAIGFSFLRIALGFLSAVAAGTILAVLSYKSGVVRELINPVFKVIKASPVASFIILALLWIKAGNLSVLISFLMVVPMTYTNVLQGILATDWKLLEMAHVFHLSKWKQIKAIYLPAVMPYFSSAVTVGLGFSWKAGIAAEVIGIPSGSIGERLYEAKLYLMTGELFAWTFVIIVISILFEKIVIYLIKHIRLNTVNDKTKNIRVS